MPEFFTSERGTQIVTTIKKYKADIYLASLGVIFIAALFVRLWFNFVWPHPNNFAACDAYEYISNGQALLNLKLPDSFWGQAAQCLTGSASPETWSSVRAALQPLHDFYISGPVFPIFVALTLLVTNSANLPIYVSWDRLICAQSIFSALTCVFIAGIATSAFNRRVGVVAGLLAAFYPGFIVNSGRLYSESFACFLLTGLTWLIVRGFQNGGIPLWQVFVSGLVAVTLQLTRSIMVVVSLVMLPLSYLQQSRRKKWLAPLLVLAGIILFTAPWVAFQKLAFGKGGMLVDRVGHYNFFVGNNTDIGGWLSYPYPDGRGVEEKSYPTLLSEQVKKSPERWVKLMLDKPARLFKYPWNDFRTPIGAMTMSWQVAYQQLLLFAAFVGMGLCLFANKSSAPEGRQLRARWFIAGLPAFHCVYFAFITVPRYNLTAMPELIIFAAAGLCIVARLIAERSARVYSLALLGGVATLALLLWADIPSIIFACIPGLLVKNAILLSMFLRFAVLVTCANFALRLCGYMEGNRMLARAVTITLAFALVPVLCYPTRASGRTTEWSTTISMTDAPVKQVIRVPFDQLEQVGDRRFFLLVDASRIAQPSTGLSVRVNGEALPGPVIPGLSLVEGFDRMLQTGPNAYQREGERMWDSLSAAADLENTDLRQWALLSLSPKLLVRCAKESIAKGKGELELNVEIANGSDKPIEIFGNYPDGRDSTIPSVSLYSWEKAFYGVENASGLTDTRYDIKVSKAYAVQSESDLSKKPGLQFGTYNVRLLAAPPAAAQTKAETLVSVPVSANSRLTIENQAQSRTVIKAPEPSSKDSFWLVRIKGKVRHASGNAAGSVLLGAGYETPTGSAQQYNSPWVPKAIMCSDIWRDFETVVPLQPTTDKAALKRLTLSLGATSPEVGFKNKYTPTTGEVEFRDVYLEVIELPSNPVGLGHRVF